jgi:hypothetical protein
MGSEQSKSPAYRPGSPHAKFDPSGIIGILFKQIERTFRRPRPTSLHTKDGHLELPIRCVTNAPAASKFQE